MGQWVWSLYKTSSMWARGISRYMVRGQSPRWTWVHIQNYHENSRSAPKIQFSGKSSPSNSPIELESAFKTHIKIPSSSPKSNSPIEYSPSNQNPESTPVWSPLEGGSKFQYLIFLFHQKAWPTLLLHGPWAHFSISQYQRNWCSAASCA